MAEKKGTSTQAVSLSTTQSAKSTGTAKTARGRSSSSKAVSTKRDSKKAPSNKLVAEAKRISKAADKPERKLSAINRRYNKREIINELAVNAGLNRKQVGTVLDELAILISRHIKKRSVGEFALAGLFKITTAKRPAKRAYQAINPFTGEMITFEAKPARTAVKVHPLKGLVDMAQ